MKKKNEAVFGIVNSTCDAFNHTVCTGYGG